jgi:hypothetical protein
LPKKIRLIAAAAGALPLYRFVERTVHLDGCVEVDIAYYSAPLGWIGAP